MKKKQFIAAALAAGLAIGSISVPASAAGGYTKAPEHAQAYNVLNHDIIKKINVNNIYKDIGFLAEKPREGGTEAEKEAVKYIEKKFKSYGYKTEIQEFTFFGYTPPSLMELNVAGHDGELVPQSFTYGPNGDVTGELAHVGTGTAEELEGQDLTGKIALVQRGGISFGEKVLNAAQKGAAGVIIYNNVDGAVNGTLGEHREDYVPVVGLTKAEGEALVAALEAGTADEASLKVEGSVSGERISHNVIATKPATNKKKDTGDIIGVGAHHDSVSVGPGANDNASGTSVTLELARVMKNVPTDTEIRFMTWGAEEFGLLGSEYYVNNLSEDEVDRFKAYFNMDMVGSRDAGDLIFQTADGEPNYATELTQATSLLLKGAETPLYAGDRSDHASFFVRGIPAIQFIHSPTEPWYHTPEDTLDKISKEKLFEVASLVGKTVYDNTVLEKKSGPGKGKDKGKDKGKKGKSKGKGHKHHHGPKNFR